MLIDTHKAIKELQGAGIPGKEAEAIVGIVTRADEQAATRDDIRRLEKSIQSLEESINKKLQGLKESTDRKLQTLEESTDRKLTALEERLTRRMYAMGFLIVATLGALNFFT